MELFSRGSSSLSLGSAGEDKKSERFTVTEGVSTAPSNLVVVGVSTRAGAANCERVPFDLFEVLLLVLLAASSSMLPLRFESEPQPSGLLLCWLQRWAPSPGPFTWCQSIGCMM